MSSPVRSSMQMPSVALKVAFRAGPFTRPAVLASNPLPARVHMLRRANIASAGMDGWGGAGMGWLSVGSGNGMQEVAHQG